MVKIAEVKSCWIIPHSAKIMLRYHCQNCLRFVVSCTCIFIESTVLHPTNIMGVPTVTLSSKTIDDRRNWTTISDKIMCKHSFNPLWRRNFFSSGQLVPKNAPSVFSSFSQFRQRHLVVFQKKICILFRSSDPSSSKTWLINLQLSKFSN